MNGPSNSLRPETEKPRLDRIDRTLLGLLQQDARLSNKELAGRVGLAPSSCLVRVQRLVRSGVLRGFHADVLPEALGVHLQAIIFVQVARHSRAFIVAFRDWVLALDEVRDVYYVAGSHDLLIHVAVRDVDHLRRIVMDQISNREEVGHLETSLIFDHRRSAGLPNYGDDDGDRESPS